MSDLTIRGWFKSVVSDLTDGAFALVRMTKQRGLHVNLRDDAGAELGTVANPINVSGSAGSPNINVAQIGGTAQSGADVVDVPNTALRVNVVAGGAGGGAVTQATSPWVVGQATGSNLHVVVDTAPSTAVTNAGLTNLDVALSTRTKPADQQHAIIDSGTTVVTQPTGTNLHVAVDSAPTTAVTIATLPALAAGSAVIGHVIVDTAPSTAVTNAGLSNLDVALSTRTKPADQQHAIIDSGTTVVTQPTGTNLHVVVDSAPSTPVSGTVAVSNTSFAATGSATPADATATPTTAQLHEAYAMLYNGVSFDMQRGTAAHGALVTDPAIWTLIGLTRQMLVEMRALRISFSTVSGVYVEDDDLEPTVQ